MNRKSEMALLLEEMEKKFVRHTGVMLEQIRSEVRTIAEGHGILTRQIQEVREELLGEIQLFRREVDLRFEQIDRRFEQVDQRFNRLETTFGTAILNHDGRIKALESKSLA